MKIALISLFDQDALATRLLHSILDKNGYDVKSFYLKLVIDTKKSNPRITDKELNLLLESLRTFSPDLAGFTVRSTFFNLTAEVTKRIKKELNTYVLWGGIHPTLCPEDCLQYADIICIGEGEEAIVELADNISHKKEFKNIQNLWVKEDGNIIKNALRPYIQNLDSLPYPDYSDNNKYYIRNDKLYESRPEPLMEYHIMTMRGCIYNCSYCSTTQVKKLYCQNSSHKGYLRRRSVKNVIDELLFAKNNHKFIRIFYFFDDVFTIDKDWIKDFCKEYKEKIGMPFYCYPHPKASDEDDIIMLKEAGWKSTAIGIQSGSDYIRNTIYRRPETKEEILRLTKLMKKYNISVLYDLMISDVLETEKDMRETLNLLLEIPKPFIPYVHFLRFYPKSNITKMALEKNLISEDDIVGRSGKLYFQVIVPMEMKRWKDKRIMFWCSLYYLTGKKYIPNKIVRIISNSNFVRKHPLIIALLKEFMHRIFLLFRYFSQWIVSLYAKVT